MRAAVSHAEVESALRLAAIGAGWPGGHADDIARATVALEHFGIAAIEAALRAVQSPVEPLPDPVQETPLRMPAGGIGSLGPAIMDCLLSNEKEVHATVVDEPVLLAGFLWQAARWGAQSSVKYDNGGVARIDSEIHWQGDRPESGIGAKVKLERLVKGSPAMLHGELQVEEDIWNRLMAAMERILVPPSEQSRARGAGPDA